MQTHSPKSFHKNAVLKLGLKIHYSLMALSSNHGSYVWIDGDLSNLTTLTALDENLALEWYETQSQYT